MNFVINQTHNRKKKYTLLSFFYQNRIFAVENSNMAYKYSSFSAGGGLTYEAGRWQTKLLLKTFAEVIGVFNTHSQCGF